MNMEMLREYGLSVPQGEVAHSSEEAKAIADKYGETEEVLVSRV